MPMKVSIIYNTEAKDNKIRNKLIIGSANVNQKYGLKKNIVKTQEFKLILNSSHFCTKISAAFQCQNSQAR